MLQSSHRQLFSTVLVALLGFTILLAVPSFAAEATNSVGAAGTCSVANCASCVTNKENECEICNGNYQRSVDKLSCVAMECKIAHCDVCVTEMTARCQICSPTYEVYAKGLMCVLGPCQVANCSRCVTGTVDQCASCASGYQLQNRGCTAVKASNSLSSGAIAGIAVGAAVFVILIVLMIVLLACCCCKHKLPTLHAVEIDDDRNPNPLARPSQQCREMTMRESITRFDRAMSQDIDATYIDDSIGSDSDSHSDSDSEEEVGNYVSMYSQRSNRRSTRRQSSRQVYTTLIDGEFNADYDEYDGDVSV